MPIIEKQVRVFISSTFRDMHAERDHLITVVFPELRERVEQLGLEFFDVDLRWGVPEKTVDGETANSWEYCRQWIDRVEPFFVCILGQRYGWVPKVTDLKNVADQTRQASEPRSITDLEVRHAVFNDRRKRRSYFYLRETLVPEPKAGASKDELETYSEFVDPEPDAGKLSSLKNDVNRCGRPVRGYDCRWTGKEFADLDKVEKEKQFGRMVLEDLWSGVLRDKRYVNREVWSQVLGADPDNDLRYTDESKPIPRELWEKIVSLAKPEPKEPLDAEREQMDAFAASRLRWFQGRDKEITQLTDFIASTDESAPRLAVVAAVPGQGKSALIARLYQNLTVSLIPNLQSAFVIAHFVGATERSASAHALVERLLGELDRSDITWPVDQQEEGQELKRDFNSLCFRLSQRLGNYTGKSRIVILLDALNQLTDGYDLLWLPYRLGPGVRVIVSCIEDAETKTDSPEQRVLNALVSRQPAPLRVPLGGLTEADVRTIVVAYLKEYCKELDAPYVDAISDEKMLPQAHSPLYLLVMLAELRTLGGNDMNRIVPALIASMPKSYPDTVNLFRWVLKRLEVFGSDEVQWWCLYLAHGRVGMTSNELADLLARKLGADAAARALRIERGLRRYLQRRGPQLDFFHSQLRQAVFEQYGQQVEEVNVHHEMADYFTACAKGADPKKEWETDSVRGFAECVFHLIKSGQHDLAAELLSNFPFLLHKTRVCLLEGVFDDYDILHREVAPEMAKQVDIWSAFFRERAHILRRGNDEWPADKILLQLAVEYANDSPLTIGAERWLAEGRCNWLWLRRFPRMPHAQNNPCLAVLEGHTGWVEGALASSNGRILSWAGNPEKSLRLWDAQNGECLAVLDGHTDFVWGALALSGSRLLSWSRDRTLRLWDGRSGGCLAALDGHTGSVEGALELTDGRLLSWSRDRTLRLWDGRGGACLAALEGHTGSVEGALELTDGRLLSWSRDRTLRLWDGRSGVCLAALEGHTGSVEGALELTDGQLLSWSGDRTLRLWDAQNGACLAALKGHTDKVRGALESADGRLVSWSGSMSGGQDKTPRLWDRRSGVCVAVLVGHSYPVSGVLVLSDSRLLSWAGNYGSTDHTLRLWDGRSGACLSAFEGHTAPVEGALELTGGRLLSWSGDKTLRLWDGLTGRCLAVLEGHSESVRGVLILVDGRLLSWSYDRTLRLWDDRVDGCLAVLEGHSDCVLGATALSDGRLLSWARDQTGRLWDCQTGAFLTVLAEHIKKIDGALALPDGRLLSWSGSDSRLPEDQTLRVWDGQTGTCLAVLEGHEYHIGGALALPDGRLLSWSEDHTLRLWDDRIGTCLEVAPEYEMRRQHPEWFLALQQAKKPGSTAGDFLSGSVCRSAHLRHKTISSILAGWEADSEAVTRCLLPDGTVVVTQANGQVSILKLHHGHRRISLAEAEALLPHLQQGQSVKGDRATRIII